MKLADRRENEHLTLKAIKLSSFATQGNLPVVRRDGEREYTAGVCKFRQEPINHAVCTSVTPMSAQN